MKIKLHFIYILLFITGMLAAGCRSAKVPLAATPFAPLRERLPALEVATDPGPLGASDGLLPEDPLRLFTNELQRNVAEPTDSATFGYARLVVTHAATRRRLRGWQAVQMALLLTPTFLGVPLETYQTDVTAEVQVSDAQGRVLGTYAGKGSGRARVAMYHGYAQKNAPRLADVLALRDALARIRPQLDTAAARLRPLLLAHGPVDNPTLPTAAARGRR
ncbi:hypothetical protein ACFQ48_01315 [Hymenobacter caeli]|uniref:DUF4136 domain-containing protein n=1 Tax=Hymenobacter caeli TaxID=2735894 RepID=A0ABX2FK20_9BACT|nr:hypothetical protein [Hymenobacter caeli]NRT17459.1 hypothetical protein [Hymenobacter caeli]